MEPSKVKDEKQLDTVLVTDVESDIDFRDKDEALRLVGLEKASSFTEEDYNRIRRKLVRRLARHAVLRSPGLKLFTTGLCHSALVRGRVLHAVSVRLITGRVPATQSTEGPKSDKTALGYARCVLLHASS